MARETKGRNMGKCECGGIVRGIKDFDRWFTWCEKCTPVVKFDPNQQRHRNEV